MRCKGLKWLIGVVLLSLIVVALLYFFWVRENFHTVVAGRVYRSAQLTGSEFATMIQRYHLRSIVNLRGASPRATWYQQEVQTAKRLGVKHYNVRLSAYHLPPPAALKRLVIILQTAPRPMLVHCEGGADRSGLASAIVLILRDQPLPVAEHQYSREYLVLSKRSVGKLVIPLYAKWLKQKHLSTSRQHFIHWVATYHR